MRAALRQAAAGAGWAVSAGRGEKGGSVCSRWGGRGVREGGGKEGVMRVCPVARIRTSLAGWADSARRVVCDGGVGSQCDCAF